MIGDCESESCSKFSTSILNPLDKDKIKAIPIIQIDEAKAVKIVLPFLVRILPNESFKAVQKLIAVFLIFKLPLLSSES